MTAARSFAPIEGERARVLILGSMPGVASLEAARYYAHPRNAFWPIVLALLEESGDAGPHGPGVPVGLAVPVEPAEPVESTLPAEPVVSGGLATVPYERRVARLKAGNIALWDVLAACVRPGSLDSAIRRDTEEPNAIPALVDRHPELRLIVFNGQAAAKLFERHVGGAVREARPDLAFATLPSTSPAYASLSPADKRGRWGAVLLPVLGEG